MTDAIVRARSLSERLAERHCPADHDLHVYHGFMWIASPAVVQAPPRRGRPQAVKPTPSAQSSPTNSNRPQSSTTGSVSLDHHSTWPPGLPACEHERIRSRPRGAISRSVFRMSDQKMDHMIPNLIVGRVLQNALSRARPIDVDVHDLADLRGRAIGHQDDAVR